MKHPIKLDYTIPTGDLTPYFDGLCDGIARASKCSACGKVAFPARALCGTCGENAFDWVELSGAAQIVWRTDGMQNSFALVQFDGADTTSTVGILNPKITNTNGCLVAPQGDAPGLWLMLKDTLGGNDDGH